MPFLPGKPLAGTRVLDFSHVLAGPMCTRLLADLGAEVLRVESGKRVDTPWRSATAPELGRTYAYVMVQRGKKSITIDLKTEEGGQLARRLASEADVVVENFSAGVMERLGLDYERLRALNPRLVFLSMSGYGHDGPRKEWKSMNANLQAYSGLMMATEREDQPPVTISISWMDYIGGLHGCFAVLEALAKRADDGKGQNIDLAQFECAVGTLGSLLMSGIVDGTRPQRLGNRSTSMAPQGCYRCAGEDEWCAISVNNDEQWRALTDALGKPAWSRNPGFDSLAGRLTQHDEIDRGVEEWTTTMPAIDVERRLQDAGVPCERMRRTNDLLELDNDGIFRLLPNPSKPILMTGLPFEFIPRQEQTFGQAPRLGEQTDDALREWLGMGPSEIAELRGSGILV